MSKRRSRGGSSALIFNVLSAFFLIGILCVSSVFLAIFTNPGLLPERFRPLPPIPTIPSLPTATPTLVQILPPTWTPVPTDVQPTFTPEPTSTLVPTETPFVLNPSATPTGRAGGSFAFGLQSPQPIAIQNVTHPELGCNWMGVGGQVFDFTGAPVTQMVIQLGGSIQGIPFDMVTLTATALQYGPGGYEFTLADGPLPSTRTLYVQILDQAGQPLSDKVFFDTFSECERNLILINFTQLN